MYNFPSVGSAQTQANSMDSGFSGRMERRAINSYESMDAGLTIKTREGDIVTLSTSRFSELSANEYSSQGYVETENGQAMAKTHERSIQLSSGQSFSFSVQGDLNEQELADIENIISGIDGIIYEMAQGDMEDAVAQALSMGSYASVSSYEADITVARSYAEYAETRTTGTSLPAQNSGGGFGGLLPDMGSSPFMKEISTLLEEQDAAALAHAQKPLSQLFDYYLEARQDQLETRKEGAEKTAAPSPADSSAKSPVTLALESTAKMVDQLIQEMVRDAFDRSLDQVV